MYLVPLVYNVQFDTSVKLGSYLNVRCECFILHIVCIIY